MGMEVGGMDNEEEVVLDVSVGVYFCCFCISFKIADWCWWVVESMEIWVTAENAYNEHVSRVENQIISQLHDRLGTVRNANEMFHVFSFWPVY